MYTFNEETMDLIQSFQETLLEFRAEKKKTQRHAAAGKTGRPPRSPALLSFIWPSGCCQRGGLMEVMG